MKKKLLLLLKVMKYSSIGFICHLLLFSVVLASHTDAQDKKRLSETYIELGFEKENLATVFKRIESLTDFNFTINEAESYLDKKVSLDKKKVSLRDLLLDISRQTGLMFQQVNHNIGIKIKDQLLDKGKDPVEEIIMATTISGTVRSDEDNQPVPGVNVIEKGTSNGVITDIEGKYTIEVAEGATLVFSSIGFQSIEVPVDRRNEIDVTLLTDVTSLEEVVVVGYGEQKKATLTGSVATTRGATIEKTPVPNITNSLQGRLPGVIANNRTGEPGRDDAQILIRGRSTFGNTQPLLVIDGVPRPTSGLGRIDPRDIESITVLKDASAAIYGARAANGVILVTTKRGELGKAQFNFTYNQGISRPTRILRTLDAATWAEVNNDAATRDGGSVKPWPDEDIQLFRDGTDPLGHPNTNWVGETLKPWALQNKANLSVSGGSKGIRYFMSLGMQEQDGHFQNNPTHFRQFNLRTNLDADITENFKVSLNLAGRLEDRTYPSTGTWVNFVNILSANPTLPARYPNGLIAAGRLTENPLLRDRVGTLNEQSYPIQTTLALQYKVPFVQGLTFNGTYNYDFTHDFNKTIEKPYTYWEYNQVTEEYEELQSNVISSPSVTDYFSRYFVSTYNLRANYQIELGKHGFNLMLGAERAQTTSNYTQAFRRNFPTTLLTDINFGSSNPQDQATAGGSSVTRRDNYFGRLNYNFSEKYLAEILFRYDGSPIFPQGKRYGFFPGASVGWRLSEESFMQGISMLDNLKLRASYGELGNDNVADPYAYLSAYSIGNRYNFGGNDVLGLSPGVLPNLNYTWEVLRTLNFGVDASFWGNLLSVELDIFRQNRSNILAERQLSISSTFGFPGLPPENIGKVKNNGFELVLTHQHNIGQVAYRVRGNLSFARNEYVYFDEVPAGEDYQNQTGHPIGAPLVWPTAGIYRDQEQIDATVHKDNARPGDVIYVDRNDDGVINNDDRYRLDLSPTPEYVFGLDLSFVYKQFDVTTFFQGQANAVYFPGITSLGGDGNYSIYRATDRWTPENRDGSMPAAGADFDQFSELNLYNNPFVRLKTLELGYNLPESLAERLKIQNLRVYVSGFNVFTIDNVGFVDPEGRGDGNDPNSTREDANYYPQLQTFNLGLDLTF